MDELKPLDEVLESGEKTLILSDEFFDGLFWAWNKKKGFHPIYREDLD